MSTTIEKKRDYLFDNYRTLLILMVVMGHFIENLYRYHWFFEGIKWSIYAFHVPAFVFISGYFSKKKTPFLTLCKKIAIPYLVFEVLYYLLYTYIAHKETHLYLMHPKFTLWYLMALFFWKFITPYFKKIPGCFLISIILGLAIGFSSMKDNFLTIPRALVFYPYFLAGTYLEKDTVTAMRNKKIGKIKLPTLCAIALFLFFLFLLFFSSKLPGAPNVFFGRYSYAKMNQTPLLGVCLRILTYIIGFGITYGLLCILPEKKYSFSFVGQRTMQVYLFHGLICKALDTIKLSTFFKGLFVSPFAAALMCIGFFTSMILLTWILSTKPFTILLQLLCFDFKSVYQQLHKK